MGHLFGDLLHQHLHRQHGLTQARLAEGILQDPAVISNMCRGRRLTGAQARERVVAIIGWLHAQKVLSARAEADALLHAAGLIGLETDVPEEVALLASLSATAEIDIDPPDHLAELATSKSATDHGPPSNLPQPTTPFVGRRRELTQLMDRLSQPACRLLSLVGPGGFGKTRLGICIGELVLERPDLAPDGVFFVALDGLESPAWVVPAIAATLNYSFHEQDEPERQLLRYLSQKRMLLILDNAEGILDARLVLGMLGNAPYLKLLVTTREALNVREEWFHPIAGMHISDGDDPAADTDAIEFFVRCAHRVRPDFQPADEYSYMQAICRSVGGVPLAIELAAAWLKGLTCQQVASELNQGIDFLTSSMRDVPERHRSLRAVLEQSWRHLAEVEQRVFRQLSIFTGGFQSEAAQTVTNSSLPVLLSLVDKSVLQLGQDGRYRIHPLLRQMGEERLAADAGEQAGVAARHSVYYLHFLRDRSATVSGPNQRQMLLEVQAEMDNVRRAWRYAARQREVKNLADALPCLVQYLWSRGRFAEGEQLMTEALGALTKGPLNEDELSLQCMLLARRALFAAATGETVRAKAILQDIQLPLDENQVSPERALVLYVRGMIASYDYVPEAYPVLSLAYEMYRELGDEQAFADTGLRLEFIVSWMMGDFASGLRLVEESLRIYRQLGNLFGVAGALENRGALLCGYGACDEAEQNYRESLNLARYIGSRWVEAVAMGGLCLVAIGRGQWDLAEPHARDRLAIMEELGHKHDIDMSYAFLGNVYTQSFNYEKAVEIIDFHPAVRAWAWSEQALIAVGRYAEAMETLPSLTSIIAEGGWRYYSVDNLTSWAMLLTSECPLLRAGEPLAQANRVEMAHEILALVRDYAPDRSRATSRTRAAKLLAELDGEGTPVPASTPLRSATRAAKEIAGELLTINLG